MTFAQGRPLLRGLALYHGKHGGGVGVETQVKHGPVTVLSMTQTRQGNLKLVAAQAESIPGPVLQIGNTDSRLKFSLARPTSSTPGAKRARPTILPSDVGQILPKIEKFASIAALELKVIC